MDDERVKAIALLEAAHQFPVQYALSVIAQASDETARDVRAAIDFGQPAPLGDEAITVVPSSAGKYASYRITVPCATPDDVLALCERLRGVPGVITLL